MTHMEEIPKWLAPLFRGSNGPSAQAIRILEGARTDMLKNASEQDHIRTALVQAVVRLRREAGWPRDVETATATLNCLRLSSNINKIRMSDLAKKVLAASINTAPARSQQLQQLNIRQALGQTNG